MPHPGFLDLCAQTRLVTKSIEAFSNDSVPFLTTGLRTYEKVLYAATLFQRTNKHVLMVYSCPEEAIVARRQLVDLIGDEKVIYFPPREVMPFENKDNREALWMRIACLNRLAGPGDPCVTVTTATSLMRKLLPEKGFIEGRMTLKKGDRVLPHEIVRLLVNGGYEKTFTVNSRGQVALRGFSMCSHLWPGSLLGLSF